MLSNEKCCGHQQTPTHGDTKLLLCLQLHHHRHPHRLPGGRDCLYNGASCCDQQSRLPYKRRGSINLHIYFSAWHLTLYQPQQETRSSDKTPQEDKKKKLPWHNSSCTGPTADGTQEEPLQEESQVPWRPIPLCNLESAECF